ncbi:MAG: glycosyltransferase family 1 protein, partial [Candidatus Riflebacteria bacterium]|nr:glycosyltransferase family 1 protein [Candidatus Riflebacteria bacterium]
MHLGIDASNIISGGGLTHLAELLKVADPFKHGFTKVTLWSNLRTLEQIVDRPWLNKIAEPLLEKAFPLRFFWQKHRLDKSLKHE